MYTSRTKSSAGASVKRLYRRIAPTHATRECFKHDRTVAERRTKPGVGRRCREMIRQLGKITYDNVTCQTAVLHEFSAGMKAQPSVSSHLGDTRALFSYRPLVFYERFRNYLYVDVQSPRHVFPSFSLSFGPV